MEPIQTFQTLKSIVAPFVNLAVDVRVLGEENIASDGKLILTCNHRSDMDPFIISSYFPRYISWIAADYTFRIPLFKDLAEQTGCIPMAIDGNVSIASIKKIQRVFKEENVLGIFPEGHDYMIRNNFSAPMAKFHDGFAIFSLRNNVEILPSVIIPVEEKINDIPIPSIVRSFLGMPKEVCQVKKRVIYKSVLLIFGEKLKPEKYQNMSLAEGTKLLAADVRRNMESLLNTGYSLL